MTATTTAWGIPYATGTDRLCDGYKIIDSMAQTLETLLSAFTSDLDRVVTVPYAAISTETDQTVGTNVSGFASPTLVIEYDTVDADTGNYTNLATLPAIITLPSDVSPTGGYFALFVHSIGFTGNAVNTGFLTPYIAVNSTLTDPAGNSYADSTTTNVGGTVGKMFAVDPVVTGDQEMFTEMMVGNLGQPTATLTSSSFFMFWVSDQ